jgi:hypothetical protein
MTEQPPRVEAPEQPELCSYAEFGEQFFRLAVTPERILGAVSGLSGDTFEVGPMGAGPGRLAKVSASGQIGQPTLTPADGPDVAFQLALPVDVRLLVDLGIDVHRFHADVMVSLRLVARAAKPLLVVIDVDPPTRDDVTVEIHGESMRASLLGMVAGIDGELRKQIARFVARELGKPALRKARQIDIAARMTKAWTNTGNAPLR